MARTKQADVCLADRISHWRRVAGLRKGELADLVGVSPSAVTLWESGENTPTYENLQAIAKACGVELRTFFGEIAGAPTQVLE